LNFFEFNSKIIEFSLDSLNNPLLSPDWPKFIQPSQMSFVSFSLKISEKPKRQGLPCGLEKNQRSDQSWRHEQNNQWWGIE